VDAGRAGWEGKHHLQCPRVFLPYSYVARRVSYAQQSGIVWVAWTVWSARLRTRVAHMCFSLAMSGYVLVVPHAPEFAICSTESVAQNVWAAQWMCWFIMAAHNCHPASRC
jgi:hypothetical protein